MKILELELKGYKRLSLNQIETIQLTPQNKFHWILGTNGSGKSSLMKELTPLAASPANYHKGGYKKIVLEHRGDIYKLESNFVGPKNLFTFVVVKGDKEEELNPGHTSTVFNNLVLQHFGITKDIHELSIGTREFSGLSPNDRKQLLTKISDTDYSFALGYFQRLLSLYRDTLGSIKTDQNRLLEAKNKMLSGQEEVLLSQEVAVLKERLHGLMSVCPNPSTPHNIVKQRLDALRDQVHTQATAFRSRLRKQKHLLPLLPLVIIDDQIIGFEAEVRFLEDTSKRSFERLDEVVKKLETLKLIHGADAKDIRAVINESMTGIIRLEKNLHSGINVSNPGILLEFFDGWQRDLEFIVPHLVADLEGTFHQEGYQAAVKEHQRGEHFLSICGSRQDAIRGEILEISNHNHTDQIECPECNHKWVPGKTPSDLKKLQEELEVLAQKEKAAKVKIEGLLEDIQNFERYQKGMDILQNFVWKHDLFKPFWEKMFHENIHKKNPEQILSEVLAFKQDLLILKEIEDLKIQIKDLTHKQELIHSQESMDITLLQDTQRTLDLEIQSFYDRRADAMSQLSHLKQQKSLQTYVTTALADLKEWKTKLETCFKDSFDHFHREHLSDFILSVNTEIMGKEKLLRSIEIQKAQVQLLESNLQETLEFSKVLKAAVQELSPSEGLIAKGLTGFINHFVGLVNSLIRKIWLYPMELVPILPDDENNIDLDYRFSVKVKDELVPDISDCSSGQKEIINLAVRIVALSFLRLDHGPLFLDEFGARMDIAHKASAFEAIANLLSTSNFTQIFMIAHFEGSYNSSLEADITVLCPANIHLPPGLSVNQHTVIT